eukprot:5127522-Pleurochrysis_carterae.AAC.1
MFCTDEAAAKHAASSSSNDTAAVESNNCVDSADKAVPAVAEQQRKEQPLPSHAAHETGAWAVEPDLVDLSLKPAADAHTSHTGVTIDKPQQSVDGTAAAAANVDLSLNQRALASAAADASANVADNSSGNADGAEPVANQSNQHQDEFASDGAQLHPDDVAAETSSIVGSR